MRDAEDIPIRLPGCVGQSLGGARQGLEEIRVGRTRTRCPGSAVYCPFGNGGASSVPDSSYYYCHSARRSGDLTSQRPRAPWDDLRATLIASIAASMRVGVPQLRVRSSSRESWTVVSRSAGGHPSRGSRERVSTVYQQRRMERRRIARSVLRAPLVPASAGGSCVARTPSSQAGGVRCICSVQCAALLDPAGRTGRDG